MSIGHILRTLGWVALFGIAMVHFSGASAQAQEETPAAPQSATSFADSYTLGSGDRLRIAVFGEADLSGEYVVDGSGFVSLPLIGQIEALGDTVREFEAEIAMKFADGYLRNPRISAEVVNYRPFYILGEVAAPGEYDYVDGMSVLNAIALAGGFTFRAQQRRVYVRRDGSDDEITLTADQMTRIYPGDIIRVGERFF
jgi:polysaccharide export outer membrane protein